MPQDNIPFSPGDRDQSQGDAVPIKNVLCMFRALYGFLQTGSKADGFGAHDLGVQFVVFVVPGDVFPHGLQRNRHHLLRQRLVDRAQPVQPQPANDGPKRRPLHQKGKQGESGCKNADDPLDFVRNTRVFCHGKRQGERHGTAQPAP